MRKDMIYFSNDIIFHARLCVIVSQFVCKRTVKGAFGDGFGDGIHNLLEAAVWGQPVVFGPNNERFAEAQDLKSNGGGYEITDATSLARTLDALTSDENQLSAAGQAAADYVAKHAGASRKILDFVFS